MQTGQKIVERELGTKKSTYSVFKYFNLSSFDVKGKFLF